jgi:hypothetical protein
LQKSHSSAKVVERLLAVESFLPQKEVATEGQHEARTLQGFETGRFMTVIQVSIDPIVVGEMLLGTVSAIAIVVAGISVMKAAAPQVNSLPASADQEIESFLASRLSMNVSAQDRTGDPLRLRFKFSDPNVALLRIEIADLVDNGARAAQCVEASPGIFVASVEPELLLHWYNANPSWDGETKLLPIRVFYLAKGLAACRTVWVTMSPLAMPGSERPNEGDFAWSIEGPYAKAIPELAQVPMQQ